MAVGERERRQARRQAEHEVALETYLRREPVTQDGRVRGPRVVTYELLYPIDRAGELVCTVTVRRATFGDVRRIQATGSAAEGTIESLRLLAALAESEVEQLDAADLAALDAIVAGFLAPPVSSGG